MSDNGNLNWIAGFIWGIADDVLRDLYVRGKYRDVILPMTVLSRLDTILGPTKSKVLGMRDSLDAAGVVNQEAALRDAAGLPFYNTSKFSLKALQNRGSQQQLKADFEDWLDGFSSNVQDILENFEFRNQVPRLSKADALGPLIEKFLDPQLKLASLDNHAMGTVFEELVRRFNEENNEEAGEHWTPRDVIRLMANLIFVPISDQVTSGTYLLYDGVIGTGGMLTVAEGTLRRLAEDQGKQVATHLYGQEINPETYAICKADLLLSGEGDEADNIIGGAEYSTISNDAFRGRTFDFMLSNPPYGKSWKTDLERMGGKGEITDPRFVVDHGGDPAFSLLTRSDDGQMLFLANMVSKMKHDTPLGSRIAEVHSGSSLFTGDAGQGESNVRRYIIENDWLEAIIQLPENSFYNTWIGTYIWIVTNRKPTHRKGKIQLIDASSWFTPLSKNLGAKSCELSPTDIEKVLTAYLDFKETEHSKIFDNEALGHRRVRVERPLRLRSQCSDTLIDELRFASSDQSLRREIYEQLGDDLYQDFAAIRSKVEAHLEGSENGEDDEDPSVPAATRRRILDGKTWLRDLRLRQVGEKLAEDLGDEVFEDFNEFAEAVEARLKAWDERLGANDKRTLLRGLSWRDDGAPGVVKRTMIPEKLAANPLFGRFSTEADGKPITVEYEADSDLTDFALVPLNEPGGVASFIAREVLPYAADSWVDEKSEKIGYEISFTRHFYKPVPLRSLVEIQADILTLMAESEGLVEATLGETEQQHAAAEEIVFGRKDADRVLVDSGVPWIGAIPDDWELAPCRAFLRPVKRIVGSRSKDYTLLSLTLRGVIVRDLTEMKGKFPASFDTYQLVAPGDFVFCLFDVDETPRTVGLSTHSGMITGAYNVFECTDVAMREYLHEFFLVVDRGKKLKPLYRGLRKTVPASSFASMRVPVPPPEERLRIVGELSEATKDIDRAILALHREAELLREYHARLMSDLVVGARDLRGRASRQSEIEPAGLASANIREEGIYLDGGVKDAD